MEEIYDLAILGAGPAGICAAIYATRGKLNTLWLEKKFVQGGQIVDTYEVDNYPGLPGITGLDLGETMVNHAEKLGIKPKREPVLSIEEENGLKVIRTKKNRYMAKAVILACGAAHRQLGIPGEEELSGMGVSYCATCDGAFFQDGTVAVVGGGNSAFDDALLLSERCHHVTLIHRRSSFRAEQILVERVKQRNNISLSIDMTVSELIQKNGQLTGLALKSKIGKDETLPVSGLFVALGRLPDTQVLVGLATLDENGYVISDEKMAVSETPGLFIAGDCRIKSVRQLTTAVSDGTIAAISACEYLEKHK